MDIFSTRFDMNELAILGVSTDPIFSTRLDSNEVSALKAKRLPSSVKEFIGAYYAHRRNEFLDRSKKECIDDIAKAVYGSGVITKFTAMA